MPVVGTGIGLYIRSPLQAIKAFARLRWAQLQKGGGPHVTNPAAAPTKILSLGVEQLFLSANQ